MQIEVPALQDPVRAYEEPSGAEQILVTASCCNVARGQTLQITSRQRKSAMAEEMEARQTLSMLELNLGCTIVARDEPRSEAGLELSIALQASLKQQIGDQAVKNWCTRLVLSFENKDMGRILSFRVKDSFNAINFHKIRGEDGELAVDPAAIRDVFCLFFFFSGSQAR
ncbi:hypothetical protein NDU88_009491 [Pleurodeles waltl]|uniref:Uncharacterized protein n=1 Tax=Pleurodeles waltl TaxID=8319 RepID=A0AAV7QXP9_PLEWA|nr:hypothetical protein NDU88_009491 [Pleurodeles waltl]